MVRKCAQVAKWIPGGGQVIFLLQRDWIMAALATAHLTLFAAFGLWLWFTIHEFGLNRECEPFTYRYLSFIVGTLPVISPTLRIFSITLSSISFAHCPSSTSWCLGVRRLLLYMASNDSWPTFAIAKDRHRHCLHHNTYQFGFLTLLVQVYFTASTELTIKYNGHQLTQNQEGERTFGQTLAAALTIIPLIQVAQEIWDNLVRWLEGDQ